MPLTGDPDAVLTASRDLASAADGLAQSHETLRSRARSITADWTGRAAPAALASIENDARAIQKAADAAARAATPLATYAEELRQAQLDYARGEQMMLDGRAAFRTAGSGAVAAADAAREVASQTMADATARMSRAEERAREANEAAARLVQEAAALLGPPAPVPPAAPDEPSLLAEFGNAAASFGNAALHNPLDGLAVITGGTLAAVGALGGLGSLALDATAVGAVAGLPLGAASAAAVVGGAGLAGAGLVDLAHHAATDNRVTPFRVDARNKDTDLPVGETADALRTQTAPGKSDEVRQVADDEAVRTLAERLQEGGVPVEGSYPGRVVTTADGTRIGLRETSTSGGPTIDITFPDGERWKVHRAS